MRRIRAAALVSCTLAFAACGERTSRVLAPHPRLDLATAPAAAACLDSSAIYSLIAAVFPAGNDRTAAEARFDNIIKLLNRGTASDTATAQEHTLALVDFTIKKFRDAHLAEGTTAVTVAQLLSGFLCYAGLPGVFDPNALGPDGAVALISPTTDTTLVTGTRWAGTDFDSGSVPQTVLVTISRIPPAGETLATQLDNYPLYYKFTMSPELGQFDQPVVVGVCQPEDLGLDPAVQGRLRLAHNVGPTGARTLEILDVAPAPFLDCDSATVLGASSSGGLFNLASRGWARVRPVLSAMLPRPLSAAAYFGGGVGGTTREFSPFGAVDPQVDMDAVSPTSQHAPIGSTVASPSVKLHTHNGTPLAGLSVGFATGANGGNFANGSQTTDATGIATAGTWTLGLTAADYTVSATATAPHAGSYVQPNPLVFTATATPPTQLAFDVQPTNTVAGNVIAPPVKVSVRDVYGDLVAASSASITMALGTQPSGAILGGTKTVTAVNGVATFSNLVLTRAGSYTLVASSSPLASATSNSFEVSAAAAATIVAVAGNGQSVPENTSVPIAPSVRVADAYDNPAPGVAVTFAIASGGGSLTGASQLTGAGGIATVGSWTVVAGTNILYANAPAGVAGSPVVFTATGTTSLAVLADCLPSQGSGDDLSRGFYLPANFKIARLHEVTLYMSSNDPANSPTTPYDIELQALAGGFNGTPIGSSRQTLYFRGNASENQQANFSFADPAVPSNTPLAFRFVVRSAGGRGTVTFNTGSCGLGDTRCKSSCPVIETTDTSGSLSTFRRKGCGIRIVGSAR